MRRFAEKYGIRHYLNQDGIEHALLPEQGLVLPGQIIIGADSHTCTYGALGAFATGVGSTDLAAAMAIGEAWFKVPSTMRFIYEGELPTWVDGKDLILYTIGRSGWRARYKAMAFCGPVIESAYGSPLNHGHYGYRAGANGLYGTGCGYLQLPKAEPLSLM